MDFSEEARQHQLAVEFERRQRNELADVLSAQDVLEEAREMWWDDHRWHEIAWLRHATSDAE